MKKIVLVLSIILCSCNPSDTNENTGNDDIFIKGADMSFLPLIESENTVFYNATQVEDPIQTLKNAGCNTIRIRLWKNPSQASSSLAEVQQFAQRVKQAGLKVWLCVHYSDTWADPAQQTVPQEWQSLSFNELKLAVENYTQEVVTLIQPEIIQVGNEINDGFLWPHGRLTLAPNQFKALLQGAVSKVRMASPTSKIMIHYAGLDAAWFFNQVSSIDYDYIGLSYYPIWHGKNLNDVGETIQNLGVTHNKKVILAETSYPFTLGWNDWTNNVVGLQNQLIPQYAATPQGQKQYLEALVTQIKSSSYGLGFCYWGGEWVAFRGNQASNGSTWENQALWDFNFKALPVLEVYSR